VTLLENSIEWNLSLAKEGSLKKRGARIEKKKKEVKPQWKSSMF
jgi:hypothetical protein